MDIFNPAINHTFRIPDDATPDEINGIIGSVEQQARSRAGILGGLGAVGRMVQSLDAPHYPTVDPVAAMAMTPQALNATLQRQAESRQQQEAIAQRERESTAQALQQEKDRRVRLQVMQQQMKNGEADRKIREQQMQIQRESADMEREKFDAQQEAAKRPQVKPIGVHGSHMVTDPLTGEVKYVASEYDRLYEQARLARENRMGTGGGSGEVTEFGKDSDGNVLFMQKGILMKRLPNGTVSIADRTPSENQLRTVTIGGEQRLLSINPETGQYQEIALPEKESDRLALVAIAKAARAAKDPRAAFVLEAAANGYSQQDIENYLSASGDIVTDRSWLPFYSGAQQPIAELYKKAAPAASPVQPPAPASPSGPPPGAAKAMRGQVPGYVLDGMFYTDDEARANGWIK